MPYQFTFNVHGNNQFSGMLKGERCIHENPRTHVRCKRTVYIGLPYCWQHMQSDEQLKIKKSTIPHSGKGLFAYNGTKDNKIIFKPKQIIANYDGERIDEATINKRYGDYTAPYGIYISKNIYEDGALQRGIGTTPNHSNSKQTNAKLYAGKIDGKKAIKVKATKNIRNNNEIFVGYGKEYRLQEEGIRYKTIAKKK